MENIAIILSFRLSAEQSFGKMRGFLRRHFAAILAGFCLLVALRCGAVPFVEVSAEITFGHWDYWLLSDKDSANSGSDHRQSLFPKSVIRRCVVGADTWKIESDAGDETVSRWFTGTNIIEYVVNTNETLGHTSFPPFVKKSTRVATSMDGNPDDAGVMRLDVSGKVCWLAFCSAPCLKHQGRKIFPPGPFWVESAIASYGWKDRTRVLDDSLGLPESVQLISTNNQTIFQYQVHQTTNVMGWNFPLEFYGIQYIGSASNGWRVDMSFKGTVKSIRAVGEPRVPSELLKARRVP